MWRTGCVRMVREQKRAGAESKNAYELRAVVYIGFTGPAHSVQSWCGQLLNISVGVAPCKARARARVDVFFRSTCTARVL